MMTTYEIFDLVSGNVLDVFETESDAIDVLVDIAVERGVAEVARFALFREIAGNSSLIAMKDALAERVMASSDNLLIGKQAVSNR